MIHFAQSFLPRAESLINRNQQISVCALEKKKLGEKRNSHEKPKIGICTENYSLQPRLDKSIRFFDLTKCEVIKDDGSSFVFN